MPQQGYRVSTTGQAGKITFTEFPVSMAVFTGVNSRITSHTLSCK